MSKLPCAVRAAKIRYVIIVEVVDDGPFIQVGRTVLLIFLLNNLPVKRLIFITLSWHSQLLLHRLVLMKLALIWKHTVIGNLIAFHQSVMVFILGRIVRLGCAM